MFIIVQGLNCIMHAIKVKVFEIRKEGSNIVQHRNKNKTKKARNMLGYADLFVFDTIILVLLDLILNYLLNGHIYMAST